MNNQVISQTCPKCNAPGRETRCPTCRDYDCGSAHDCDVADFRPGGYRYSRACNRIVELGGWNDE